MLPYALIAGLMIAVAAVFFNSAGDMVSSAGEFPTVLAVLVIVLAGMMLFEVAYLLRRRPAAAADRPDDVLRDSFFHGTNLSRTLLFMATIVLYVALMQPVGYFVVTPVFLFATLTYMRAAKPRTILILSVAATLFVYGVFRLFLELPIPMGIFA